MFLHSNTTLSKVFQLAGPFTSIILDGPSGTGRFSYVQAYIRGSECKGSYHPFLDIENLCEQECSCPICQKFVSGKLIDVLVFNGDEGIDDFREKVFEFVNSNPVELKYRYLVFKNLDKMSKKILDTLLKVFEEPKPYLRILSTTTSISNLATPILSRSFIFKHPFLSKDQLALIVSKNSLLRPYEKFLKEYEFDSVSKIILFRKYGFLELFDNFFTRLKSPSDLKNNLEAFMNRIKDSKEFFQEEILEFFLFFYINQVMKLCSLNKDDDKWGQFSTLFMPVIKASNYSLLRYLRNNNLAYYINLENQLYSFFNAIILAKAIAGFYNA